MEFLKVPKSNVSRRKFFGATAFLIGSFAILKRKLFLKNAPVKTTKLLTRDGKLVEVDLKKIPKGKRPVTNSELASWVWKNQKL